MIRALACRTYAPVGGHRDLLAYLVRRLLENGANSSFVSVAADPTVPVAGAPEAPGRYHRDAPEAARHPPHAAAARSLRPGAAELARRGIRPPRVARSAAGGGSRGLAGDVPGRAARRRQSAGRNEAPGRQPDRRRDRRGQVTEAARSRRSGHGRGAARASRPGAQRRSRMRAAALLRAADLLEARRGALHRTCCRRKAARPSTTRIAEIREAVDFCRYYARQARAPVRRRRAHARPDRREQRAAPARARRVRLHLAVEFSARDLPRPGRARRSPPATPWSPSPPSRRR